MNGTLNITHAWNQIINDSFNSYTINTMICKEKLVQMKAFEDGGIPAVL